MSANTHVSPTKLGSGNLILCGGLQTPVPQGVQLCIGAPTWPLGPPPSHLESKLLFPCSAPHHLPVSHISGFSCHSNSCFQFLLQNCSIQLQDSHRHTGPSSPHSPHWPHYLWRDTPRVASLCPWLAFCHPPSIVLGT